MSSYANHMRRSHRSEKTHRTSAASMQRFSSLKGRAGRGAAGGKRRQTLLRPAAEGRGELIGSA